MVKVECFGGGVDSKPLFHRDLFPVAITIDNRVGGLLLLNRVNRPAEKKFTHKTMPAVVL